jgi:dipeptidyl aminopeptidase/acylaminoacyl peptidase
VVLVAHGWHTPTDYLRHTGVVRENRIFARHGYVVLQPDYRNYGSSTKESQGFVPRPLGYPEDIINAVLALRSAHLPGVEPGPVSIFGRSMGGGASLQALAARPHLFGSAVLYSPVGSSAADTYRRWVLPDAQLRRRVVRDYGTPAGNPRVWATASVRNYLSRITAPIQIDHGTSDTTCPPRWSLATARALRHDGKEVQLLHYAGESHAFREPAFDLLMRRALRFFAIH